MTLSGYIAQRIKAESGVAFGVTGGTVVNFVDALHKAGVHIVPTHHEQAAAMAADAFARVSGKIGFCFGTSGPGAGNMLTGLCCSYYDSVPVAAIGGQVPSSHFNKGGRQFGFQETNNVEIFKPVTKVSKQIVSPIDFDITLNDAMEGRTGPVYIEICDDVQRSEIGMLEPVRRNVREFATGNPCIYESLRDSKKPIIILGAGIKQSGVVDEARTFAHGIGAPVLLTWGAIDLLDDADPINMRDFGVTAQRAGNYALKHADLVIAIGTRLDTHLVGNYKDFAPNANLIVIEQDKLESDWKSIRKNTIVLSEDIRNLICSAPPSGYIPQPCWSKWMDAISKVRSMFPLDRHDATDEMLGPYSAITALSDAASDTAIVIADTGQTVAWTFQAWRVKLGQTLFTAFNHSPMGYAVPASIGASIARGGAPVTAITGDGGLMMNIQELQTIVGNKLPIRVVVIDNGGYGMIRQTLSDWDSLDKDVICGEAGGLTFPSIDPIAAAFGLEYVAVSTRKYLLSLPKIPTKPELVHIRIPPDSRIHPKLKWGSPLERSTPHLTDEQEQSIAEILGY